MCYSAIETAVSVRECSSASAQSRKSSVDDVSRTLGERQVLLVPPGTDHVKFGPYSGAVNVRLRQTATFQPKINRQRKIH